jgi:thioredoxin 2
MIVDCPSCERQNRLPAARLGEKARCAACKATLLPLTSPLRVASREDFEELVSRATLPVVVDFWAGWCGPCRAVAPEVERLARERAGSVVVCKVDTEALPDVAGSYGIRSIPTMLLFRAGREAGRTSGAMPASEIAARLAI